MFPETVGKIFSQYTVYIFHRGEYRKSNMAMESGPFINDFPIKSSIDSRVSIVILISRGYHYQWEFQDPKVEVR